MKIFHYLNEDMCQDPWEGCIFNNESQLADLHVKPLVYLNQIPIICRHHSTYLTGRCTSHARDFARMIAGSVLSGGYDSAPSLQVSKDLPDGAKVLWIDTVNGPHTCAEDFRDTVTRFCNGKNQFFLLCLDMLGTFRENYYGVIRHIEQAIRDIKPTLVVIDDIDHFMPYCGWNAATKFNHVVRDTLSFTDTAFLFIGYNELGKRANTTTHVGKVLFPEANTVISLGTQHAVTCATLIRSRYYGMNRSDFYFVIGNDNCPREVFKTKPTEQPQRSIIEEQALRDIIEESLKPDETISPDDLYNRVNARRLQLNKLDHTRALIAQATRLGIIHKSPHDGHYAITPHEVHKSVQV